MTYNLTPHQKDLARFLVDKVRQDELTETFGVIDHAWNKLEFGSIDATSDWTEQDLVVLEDAGLLSRKYTEERTGPNSTTIEHVCTFKGLIYHAVDTDFADLPPASIVSTLAQPHPPEIGMPLDRLRERYPDQKKLGFLIMRFAAEKPYERIVSAIKQTADEHGLKVVRADEHEFHGDLLSNIQTYLHGCGFGIAVYDRIQSDEPNANVGLEVGYLMAMNKPVLLLKDQTLPMLPSDLAGRLYKRFDPHDPEGTIPGQLTKWLEDYGIIVRKH